MSNQIVFGFVSSVPCKCIFLPNMEKVRKFSGGSLFNRLYCEYRDYLDCRDYRDHRDYRDYLNYLDFLDDCGSSDCCDYRDYH